MKLKLTATLALAAALAAAPALAQKSQDTIRIGINDMFSVVDPYHLAHQEAAQFYRIIYGSLIVFDERKKVFHPGLAKSYKRIDKMTLEFDLRDDVKFHNGKPFDASDVKATFDYIGSPKLNVRFTSRFNWVKEVEILGPYKIRLHANRLNATDLINISYHMKILEGQTLNSLENKSDYGRVAPIATGPYKIVYVDRNKGVLVERFDGFYGDPSFRAPVKRMHGLPIPDRQTQKAQLLTGGVDIVNNVTGDDAEELGKVPNLAITYTPSGQLGYVTLDAAGRSANKVMTDERVRKAFIMAIDVEKLVRNMIPGGKNAEIAKALCLSSTANCVPTTARYPYDPAQAKRLLVEAGYPNGFDMTLSVYQPFAYFAEAMSGELSKVGIRASIDALSLTVYTKKRGAGELTAFHSFYPSAALPMMSNIMDVFFGDNRDYYNDPVILKALQDGAEEFESDARDKIYAPALDRINQKAYILPIGEAPEAWAHTKDVKILPNRVTALTPLLGDFAWSDYKE